MYARSRVAPPSGDFASASVMWSLVKEREGSGESAAFLEAVEDLRVECSPSEPDIQNTDTRRTSLARNRKRGKRGVEKGR